MKFPEVTDVDMAFGTYPKNFFQECLLKESKPKYEEIVHHLFFEGGEIPHNKSLPKDHLQKGLRIFKSIMCSWDCKHEHKVHVCGVILEELNKEIDSSSSK